MLDLFPSISRADQFLLQPMEERDSEINFGPIPWVQAADRLLDQNK